LRAAHQSGQDREYGRAKKHDEKTDIPSDHACLVPQPNGNFKANSPAPCRLSQTPQACRRVSARKTRRHAHGLAHHRLPLDPQFRADSGAEGAGAR
jgi:hypothetical protein